MVITCYSYKGGVGRSLALANIACLLAEDPEHPQRVLLWDFDLEAPGLHRLFPPRKPQRYGFVDLVYEYATTRHVPDFHQYVYESHVKGVDVLPAGDVDQSYCEKLQQIDWASFFSDSPEDPGPLFGPLLDSMRNQAGYDYVLIDSRTGLNDQAGVCTQVLPDLLIVLFRLNDQNLDGLKHIVPAIRAQLAARKRSDVKILPIAAVVAATSSEGIRQRRDEALDIFGEEELGYIRFDNELVVQERLFCLRANQEAMWPLPPIIEDYERTCRAIRKENAADTRTATLELRRRFDEGDYPAAASLLEPLLRRRPQLGALWDIAQTLDGIGQLQREVWEDLIDSLLEQDTDNVYCHEWKAASCVKSADSLDSPALQEAKRHLQEAIRLAPNRARPLRTFAQLTSCLGDFEAAVSALRKCRALWPDNTRILGDLAALHVRMGANYFAAAAEELEEAGDAGWGRLLASLALLRTFLGEHEKAAKAFTALQKRVPSWHVQRNVEAQMHLLRGHREQALDMARESLSSERHVPAPNEVANWCEFFICAEDFEGALRTAALAEKTENLDGSKLEAVTELAKCLIGNGGRARRVLARWRQNLGWSFTELVIFRERALREGRDYSGRLSIIEDIIRLQDLALMKVPQPGGRVRRRAR